MSEKNHLKPSFFKNGLDIKSVDCFEAFLGNVDMSLLKSLSMVVGCGDNAEWYYIEERWNKRLFLENYNFSKNHLAINSVDCVK